MAVNALKLRLPVLPKINTDAIANKFFNRLRSTGGSVSLWVMSLPARPIIIGIISVLVAANFVRAALPFILNAHLIGYSSALNVFSNGLLLLDNFSIVILFAALWLTKFNSASEMKTDLTYLALGILLKQFAWHAGIILSSGLLNDVSQIAPFLNWVWVWGCIYALALLVVWEKGSRYVRSSSASSQPVRNKSTKK